MSEVEFKVIGGIFPTEDEATESFLKHGWSEDMVDVVEHVTEVERVGPISGLRAERVSWSTKSSGYYERVVNNGPDDPDIA